MFRSRLADLDLLSPILVKEFRQGVRGNIFTGVFLLLHGLMVLAMCLSLLEPSAASQGMTIAFWLLLGGLVGVLIPVSGMTSVSSESTLKALEPMLLTRLTPRAIVFGKWASLTAQNLILVISVAPYLLLRYFLGGIQIADEFWGLLVLVSSSALVAAVAVGLSAFRFSPFFRWIACISLLWMMSIFVISLFASRWAAVTGGPIGAAPIWTGLAFLSMLVMLDAGAWHIAAAADRSSALSRRAILIWLAVAAYALSGVSARLRDPAAVWTGLLALLVVVGSLCEQQTTIPSVYARYFARGRLRYLGGWVFAPGWASGVVFAVITTVAACFALRSAAPDLTRPEVLLAGMGQILLPVVLMRHIRFPRVPPLAFYLIVQFASCAAGSVAGFGNAIDAPALAHAGAWLMPLSPLMALAMESDQPELTPAAVDALSLIVAGTAVVLALAHAVRTLRHTMKIARRSLLEASVSPEPEPSPMQVADKRVANL